jgi:DNA-binding protein Fis
MTEKERMYQRCIDDLEKALLELVEKYGPTQKSKAAISQLTIARADFGD